eukprot:TRINITY_DN53599_c0_g1_i1.p1 TRINITY_DN53599_c0_g1~~TRINITY_DN53599_c0_g1_i1.p1  ORF type:complete len:327 (+),score=-3.87 TRINITY_DN53599_c0_g1_i1:35-1015(+)
MDSLPFDTLEIIDTFLQLPDNPLAFTCNKFWQLFGGRWSCRHLRMSDVAFCKSQWPLKLKVHELNLIVTEPRVKFRNCFQQLDSTALRRISLYIPRTAKKDQQLIAEQLSSCSALQFAELAGFGVSTARLPGIILTGLKASQHNLESLRLELLDEVAIQTFSSLRLPQLRKLSLYIGDTQSLSADTDLLQLISKERVPLHQLVVFELRLRDAASAIGVAQFIERVLVQMVSLHKLKLGVWGVSLMDETVSSLCEVIASRLQQLRSLLLREGGLSPLTLFGLGKSKSLVKVKLDLGWVAVGDQQLLRASLREGIALYWVSWKARLAS